METRSGGPAGRRANRLSRESSPYLLQHAHNPLDWWAWGDAAFAEARRRDVPVLLSIGYSTCYWCHVMERECFEDERVAALLNERLVCVKVDREERPDIDDAYMMSVQLTTGRGGWPMTVFVEPEQRRPFWCGTYLPPEPRGGMRSLPQIVEALSRAWAEDRAGVLNQAEAIAQAVREELAASEAGDGVKRASAGLGASQVADALGMLLRTADTAHGGFGREPKFPQPVLLTFLLDARSAAGDDETRRAVERVLRVTLDGMACGGVFDQVGGGFHRYSVDATWTVPHFEKMLYDNAALLGVYARASRELGDEWWGRVARRVWAFVEREMMLPGGAFASALDAECDGREGRGYVWTVEEVRAALPPDDAAWISRLYGLEGEPNFSDPHHPEEPAAYVPRLAARPDGAGAGAASGVDPRRLDAINGALRVAREGKARPRRDDKVIVAWNGMMIGALAQAGADLNDAGMRAAGARAARWVLQHMRDASGGLLRTWRDGTPGPGGVLEDSAWLAHGLLALTRHGEGGARGAGAEFLEAAVALLHDARRRFGGARPGLYFDSSASDAELFVRPRSTYDGATASAGSVLLHGFIDLFEITGDGAWRDAAAECLAELAPAIARSPLAAVNSTRGLLRLLRAGGMRGAAHAAPGAGPGGGAEPGGTGRAGHAARGTGRFTGVEVFCDRERVVVRPDEPGVLELALRIAPGHHILAAEPGSDVAGALAPLRVGIVGGSGVRAYADYPSGEAFGPDGRLRVHRGEVRLRVALERVADEAWRGRPLLVVSFQACSDNACLEATAVELDVAIDPG